MTDLPGAETHPATLIADMGARARLAASVLAALPTPRKAAALGSAAKALREQFQRPRPAPDSHEGLTRDLTDYDRAFGLIDAGLAEASTDSEEVA